MKYLGLINLVFILTIVTILIKKSGKFNFSKFTFSDLGEKKRLGFWFNISLIIFSINQILFSLQVSKSEIANALFITGGLFLCFAGIFTTRRHQKLHTSSAFISACFVGTGVIIVSKNLIETNPVLGTLTILATLLLPVCFYSQKWLPNAKWETLLFTCIAIWNICFSVPLLF